jgi:hypothetical protein
MDDEIDVVAIQREKGLLLLSNGERGWVTNWFDCEGDECLPNDAAACVGTDQYDCWYSIDLTKFDPAFSH